MFNRGANWTGFLKSLREQLLKVLPEEPTVVEVGHGDGHFLAGLAEARPRGRYVGFDPHGARQTPYPSVFLRDQLFDPALHISELKPDLIVSRHVLEHLTNPLGLLQGINFSAGWLGKQIHLLLEVPCVDRAVEYRRLADFYYEHSSQFTSRSFRNMLLRANFSIEHFGHGYNNEVVYSLLRTKPRPRTVVTLEASLRIRPGCACFSGPDKEAVGRTLPQREKDRNWGGV